MRKRDTALRRLEFRRMCVLRAPHFSDELARILGDEQEPYNGVLESYATDTLKTAPAAEDRALVRTFSQPKPNNKSDGKHKPLTLHFGNEALQAAHNGTYPSEHNYDYLFVCPYCLTYRLQSDLAGARHLAKCTAAHPPGAEVYRDGDLSVFKVDGQRAMLYCQQVCMLAKLFIMSKQLYREVSFFFFFVLTRREPGGRCRFLGYFSKPKSSDLFKASYQVLALSCIFTLPLAQRQGYGQLLIELSYLLVSREHNVGAPETPLSEMGLLAFRSFWKRAVCLEIEQLVLKNMPVTVNAISKKLGMVPQHVAIALEAHGWLKDGRDVVINERELAQRAEEYRQKTKLRIKPELLVCAPLY